MWHGRPAWVASVPFAPPALSRMYTSGPCVVLLRIFVVPYPYCPKSASHGPYRTSGGGQLVAFCTNHPRPLVPSHPTVGYCHCTIAFPFLYVHENSAIRVLCRTYPHRVYPLYVVIESAVVSAAGHVISCLCLGNFGVASFRPCVDVVVFGANLVGLVLSDCSSRVPCPLAAWLPTHRRLSIRVPNLVCMMTAASCPDVRLLRSSTRLDGGTMPGSRLAGARIGRHQWSLVVVADISVPAVRLWRSHSMPVVAR